MKLWIKITAGAVPAAAALFLLILFLWRRKGQQPLVSAQVLPQFSEAAAKPIFGSIHAGINKLHLSCKSGSSARRSLRFQHLNHHHHTPVMPPPPPFNWDEHPRLITEAVETGWPRFAFTSSTARASSDPLWAVCPACHGVPAESGWEVPPGSSEFMQTVRLNSAAKRNGNDPSFSWARMGLPLPGPVLGGGSFPQESYFEITVLHLQLQKKIPATTSKRARDFESDQVKLIRANSGGAAAGKIFASDEPISAAEQGNSGETAVSVGLISRGATLLGQSMPGTIPGSIGFHSDGSLYLDGRRLVVGSDRGGWAHTNTVIGCGFEPRKKKVFFTVDSKLTHVVRCTSEAYSSPLYPILAADADAMLLVNLGQAPFKYAPANSFRTPNPCFIRPASGDTGSGLAAGYVDSRELFSMSRVDADWLERDKRTKRQISSSSNRIDNFDDSLDAESDLFEISLQG